MNEIERTLLNEQSPEAIAAYCNDEQSNHSEELNIPSGIIVKDGYFWTYKKDKDGNPKENQIKVSTAFNIIASTQDYEESNHGALISFSNRFGIEKQLAVVLDDLHHNDGALFVKRFTREGGYVSPIPYAKQIFRTMILSALSDVRMRCSDQIGWINDTFLLPEKCIGESEEKCVYQPKPSAPNACISTSGTLAGWRENLAALAPGNSRLVFAISSQFAGPLLTPLNEKGGGINLFGDNSSGKTTTLMAASSVCGHPNEYRHQWLATMVGIEELSFAHNDLSLVLDESGQMPGNFMGDLIYMMSNGQGKIRHGDDKHPKWRVLIISSSEQPIHQSMGSSDSHVNAGQVVRLIDIPVDAGKGFGAFEDIKQCEDSRRFAETIEMQAGENYGHPLEAFLTEVSRELKNDRNGFITRAKKFREAFLSKKYLPENADNGVRRVASRLSIIAFAGELATNYGITGWKKGESMNAALQCLNDWLSDRGGSGSEEGRIILENVYRFFQKHFSTRSFIRTTDSYSTAIDHKGFSYFNEDNNEVEYWVLPAIFKDEVCQDYNPKTVKRICIDAGLLMLDPNNKENRVQQKKSIPVYEGPGNDGKKTKYTWVYVFSHKVLGG